MWSPTTITTTTTLSVACTATTTSPSLRYAPLISSSALLILSQQSQPGGYQTSNYRHGGATLVRPALLCAREATTSTAALAGIDVLIHCL
jgi:hypothetical protein